MASHLSNCKNSQLPQGATITPHTAVRAARLANHLSRREVAVKLDTTEVSLWRYETGRSRPRPAMRRKLAGLYGVPVDELFPPENAESPDPKVEAPTGQLHTAKGEV